MSNDAFNLAPFGRWKPRENPRRTVWPETPGVVLAVLRLLILSVLLCTGRFCLAAEYGPRQRAALTAIPSELRYFDFIWASTEGDVNGDGIHDMAMVLTGSKTENDPMEERLFVLAGSSDGTYKVLSISAEFCHPSKFYNLDIEKSSLFAQMVEYADANRVSSYTLQFRYNSKLGDLELIGKEENGENYEDGSMERTSTNYLTGKVIHTTKIGSKSKTRIERNGKSATPTRLNGYSCRG